MTRPTLVLGSGEQPRSNRDRNRKTLSVNVQIDPNSICVFYKVTQDGTCKAFGTGFFFMENDLVATAKHVMEDHDNAREPYTP